MPLRRVGVAIGALVGLVVALVAIRKPEVGLLDWDTYGRLGFIHAYHVDQYVDGHLLYHGVMRVFMALGFTGLGAVVVETALGMAVFIGLLAWLCVREKLAPRASAMVLAAATIGSPGLVALFLMSEDNVLYFPVVLGVFALLYRVPTHPIRHGIALGVLLAVAMLINISLLVMLFALPPAIVWSAIRPADRGRAAGLGAAMATALATYYLAHVVPFTGAKIALHEFLPQALGLHDFHLSSTPVISLARFAEYRGGLRAMALTPNLHLMAPPDALRTVLVSVIPPILCGSVLAIAIWVARARRAELVTGLRARIALVALFGIALGFPYFYEPSLIERWDVFWIGALFALVPLFAARPPRIVVGIVIAMIALQGVGTVVTIVHHYGLAWPDPDLLRGRAATRAIITRRSDVVVLPYAMPRLVLADLAYRIGRHPTIYLVRDDGACFELVYQTEQPIERAELQRRIAASPHPYLDPGVRL